MYDDARGSSAVAAEVNLEIGFRDEEQVVVFRVQAQPLRRRARDFSARKSPVRSMATISPLVGPDATRYRPA